MSEEWNGWLPDAGLLKGRVALIAGGGGGIGEATTRILAAAGAAVVVVDEWVQTGHPFEWLRVEHVTWHDHSGFTIEVVHRALNFVHSGTLGFATGDLNDPVWAGGFLIAVVGAWLLVRRRLPAPSPPQPL